MPDPIFENSRLVALYDVLDGDRDDLDPYLAILDELGARRVVDIGCGTGTFAVWLAAQGVDVTAVDPPTGDGPGGTGPAPIAERRFPVRVWSRAGSTCSRSTNPW